MMIMLQTPLAIFSCLCLFMAVSSTAQAPPPVLDSAGQPLKHGVQYFIQPAVTDVAGPLTLKSRSGTSCPLFVAQEPVGTTASGLPVMFTPSEAEEDTVREGMGVKIVFEAVSTCIQSTQWIVGGSESTSGRLLVEAGREDGPTGLFRINKDNQGLYNVDWCPDIEARPRCGRADVLVENGVRLLALGGSAFPFVFVRA